MGSIHTGLKSSKTRVGRAESFDSHESWAPVFVFFSFGMLHTLLLAAVVAPVEWRKTRIPNLFCIIYFDTLYEKLFENSPCPYETVSKLWMTQCFVHHLLKKEKKEKLKKKRGVSLYSHVHGFPTRIMTSRWAATHDKLAELLELMRCSASPSALGAAHHALQCDESRTVSDFLSLKQDENTSTARSITGVGFSCKGRNEIQYKIGRRGKRSICTANSRSWSKRSKQP